MFGSVLRRPVEIDHPSNGAISNDLLALANQKCHSWFDFSDVLLRTHEAEIGANGIARIDLLDIRILMGGVPVAAIVIELRPVIAERGPTPSAMLGREERNNCFHIPASHD